MGVDQFEEGNHWVWDEKTGRKIRAKDARKEWTGLVTHRDYHEDRHPQEFVRARRDKQSVDDPRPPPVATYTGPLKTLMAADHAAGSTNIEVESSSRMGAGDRVEVLLAGGDVHRTVILSVPDATHITLLVGLSNRAESGGVITNYSAMSESDVG